MQTREWTFRNRSWWPEGTWGDEPDKVQWVDPTTGLPCMVVRSFIGAWTGYVGVYAAHPLYGRNPTECPPLVVHGGVNRTEFYSRTAGADASCHQPVEGPVWWIGFDCAHTRDLCPALGTMMVVAPCTYRDLDYVCREVGRLAQQLKIFVEVS